MHDYNEYKSFVKIICMTWSPKVGYTTGVSTARVQRINRPLLGESGHWGVSSKSPIYDIRECPQRVVCGLSLF